MPRKRKKKHCSCLSGEMVWEIKNAHIQPLRFRELFLFSPIEQFEHQGRKTTKPVNICHSLSATLQWWLAHGGESVFLSVSRRLPPAALRSASVHVWICNLAVCVCLPICLLVNLTITLRAHSFTWSNISACHITIFIVCTLLAILQVICKLHPSINSPEMLVTCWLVLKWKGKKKKDKLCSTDTLTVEHKAKNEQVLNEFSQL